MKLSVVIPSWKDPLLIHTIDSLLANSELGDQLEIIGVLDGYWPNFDLRGDPRVRYVHLGKNRGMRDAINAGVSVSRGEFIMRSDEHCLFAQGFDRIMIESCETNWIMTARRYFLNPVKWEIMEDQPFVDYEKLVIQGGIKFAGQRWKSRDQRRSKHLIDETMAMQGSVWVMPRKWWDEVIGELDTKIGPLVQDSHEIVFKTWQAGGSLMLNKQTFFAHKHRSFSRTHNNGTIENPANCDASYKYMIDKWRDYYEKVVRLRWGI